MTHLYNIDYGLMNATYTSPDVQNEVLGVMAGLIQDKVCDGVSYHLMKPRICSKVEQLSIALDPSKVLSQDHDVYEWENISALKSMHPWLYTSTAMHIVSIVFWSIAQS